MPFGKAARMLEEMLGVAVSQAMAVRNAEAAGAAFVTLHQAEAYRIVREAPPKLISPPKKPISAIQAQRQEVLTI